MNDQTSGRANEKKRLDETTRERETEWPNGRTNGQMTESTNERWNERTSGGTNEWTNEQRNKRTNQATKQPSIHPWNQLTKRDVGLGPNWSVLFLGFTWRHKLCLNQCPPCWCPSGVKFTLIIVYFYSDASLLSLNISPTTSNWTGFP